MTRWRRHDLVWLDATRADAFRAALADREAVAGWIAAGRPVVVTRHMPDADPAAGIAAGFTLPDIATRRRVALAFAPDAVLRHRAALAPGEVIDAAPPGWRATLARLGASPPAGASVGVYGSLSTQAVSGEACVRPSSDLDLIVDCADADALRRALAWLAALDATALPGAPRLDGEVRIDGRAVAWREAAQALAESFAATDSARKLPRSPPPDARADAPAPAGPTVLVKTDTAVALTGAQDWLHPPEAADDTRRAA
ncbi:malonate decarboxylase holo-[acyl-carrier-protein] synthase [Derxia gummosa]|uniref:Malonate decarboxylase holo-[acyl-carrier-protein] synthase n=1 Tax=Derxia gummosa DSM 723 TaxID=1121388 RepID=A0A8B6X9J5_9BURK|nr:malonate decarboxylase holo-[acyl-carrier-protein] synthase [Derxia gummosa]